MIKPYKKLRTISAKSKNRRVSISLLKEVDGEDKLFRIRTKKLIDFKTRNIYESEDTYTVDSLRLLSSIIEECFLDNTMRMFLHEELKELLSVEIIRHK
jgi:hypothetical protein